MSSFTRVVCQAAAVLVAVGLASFSEAQLITVDGTITGPSGTAVPEVDVWVYSTGGSVATTVTDAAGQYHVQVPPGSLRVSLLPQPATRLAEYNGWIGDHTESFTWDATLRQGALVSGTVLLPAGPNQPPGSVGFTPVTWWQRDGEWLSAQADPDTGTFSVVLPLGVYWAAAVPPLGLYAKHSPIDASSGDVTGIELSFTTDLSSPIPPWPADLTKIEISTVDDLGEATISGSPGSVLGNAHVMLVNLDGLQQTHAVSAEDGSFTARLFAPPGSTVLIKHGAEPLRSWHSVDSGVSMDLSWFPGTIFHLPFAGSAAGERVPFTVIGPHDFTADFDITTENYVSAAWIGTGSFGPRRVLERGDPFDVEGSVRIVGPGIDSTIDAADVVFVADIQLLMVFDADGRAVAGTEFMASRLTPTGFPILGSKPALVPLADTLSAGAFQYDGSYGVEAPVTASGVLPADLPPGVYRPVLFPRLEGVPSSEIWHAAEVFGAPLAVDFVLLPPIFVVDDEPIPTPRLIWRLLQEDPVLGTRGTGALEDRGRFEFTQLITSQGAPLIVPPTDLRSGRTRRYRLEPYLPRISFADRRIPSRPLVPFKLPGGILHVVIEEPGGGLREIGPTPFQHAVSQSRTTPSGAELNVGTTQHTDPYSLSTGDSSFEIEFEKFGRHFVIMQGQIHDTWDNLYNGGGGYELWVAHPLDIDFGVLPGTPFEVGDTFNPAVRIHPRVPADVEITVTHYPDSNPATAQVHTITGRANQFGHLTTAVPDIAFDAPGEYRVDLVARYWDDRNELWMGAATWGGIVMTPAAEAQLVAHGRRGLDVLESIPGSWFVANRDLAIPGGSIPHLYNAYFAGDMLWSRMLDAPYGGDSLIIAASAFDAVGTLAPTIRARADRMRLDSARPGTLDERFTAGEIPLFSSTLTGRSPLLPSAQVDQIGYSYRSSQRPGVRVREVVSEDPEDGGYWRLDTLYDDQPGVGLLGDQVNDFKFQYVGVVFRDLQAGVAEYLGHATGWVFIPDDDVLGTRTMPPFAGPGNGGWTTEGGPIMTIRGEDIHLFVHPTGTPPGAVLEVGETIRFAGHLMPPLPSRVRISVTSPSQATSTIVVDGNRVGYVFDPSSGVVADEPGVWEVQIHAWHDGSCSGGSTVSPYPSGNVLGSDDGRYPVFVVEPNAPRLEVTTPRPGFLPPGPPGGTVPPIVVSGPVPEDLEDATVSYHLGMAGWILDEGSAMVSDGRYSLSIDPVALQQTFPNLDLAERCEGRPGLADTLSLSLMLRGESNGTVEWRANTITLQGQQITVGGDGRGLVQPRSPRHADGRSR